MPAPKDLTGQAFGRWTAISPVAGSRTSKAKWLCRCSCEAGTEAHIATQNLISGRSTGCINHKPAKLKEALLVNLVGQRFCRLTVEAIVEGQGDARFLCQCDCGRTKEASGAVLKSGNTKSCGCLNSQLARERILERTTIPKQYDWTVGVIERGYGDLFFGEL